MENQIKNQKEEQKKFNPTALIETLENTITPEMAAIALDRAMLYLVQHVLKEGFGGELHSSIYWELREMRNAILIGSHNIDLD